ncbi:MAG: methylmalonyl-CoA mutase family protein [Candidatus Aminicenantes bacterium]|jgi:methylmalonyl-CoA mutase N-terminal domain/subunit
MGTDKDKKAKFFTSSGIEVKQVYSQKDLTGFSVSQDLGEPGKYPFTRGVYSTMYRGKLWTMRQYAGFGTAEESNRRYRFLLSQGQTGISVAFDLPTQLGLDSDDPLSHGEVGKVGVAIDSLEDMEILFKRIPLDKISVSMTINSTAAIILAMYLALADKKGIKWSSLSGTIQNDILKEYIARGTYIFPPQESLKIITDILAFCHNKVPNWNTMSISGYHIREAGATAVQELAFTFANAITYVKAAVNSGLDVDIFAPRLSFFLASHNNFFEEIAKFRAARRIWARLMREEFHAKDPLSWKFRFHTQTSGVALLAQQPENNVVRVTLQALASVLGGTQSLHTNSWDEALALPSEEAAQIALRTQQIIAYESGIVKTADPVGGSFLMESLTNQIEEKVKEYLQKIEELGGMLVAIEKGFIQKEIQESAYIYQKQVENKEQVIVGLNKYQKRGDKIHYNLYSPPKAIETNQVKKIRLLKKSRSAQKVKNRLDALRSGVESDENILPLIIEAVKAKATLGEISTLLKETFGTFNEMVTL